MRWLGLRPASSSIIRFPREGENMPINGYDKAGSFLFNRLTSVPEKPSPEKVDELVKEWKSEWAEMTMQRDDGVSALGKFPTLDHPCQCYTVIGVCAAPAESLTKREWFAVDMETVASPLNSRSSSIMTVMFQRGIHEEDDNDHNSRWH